jgi:hypothetical protein
MAAKNTIIIIFAGILLPLSTLSGWLVGNTYCRSLHEPIWLTNLTVSNRLAIFGDDGWFSMFPTERFSLGSFLPISINAPKENYRLKCGERFKHTYNNRIVGGKIASIDRFP